MRPKALALALLAGIGTPALAEDGTQVLRQALGRMPQVVTTNPEPIQVSFLDMQAWRRLDEGKASPAAISRLSLGASIEPLQALNMRGFQGWSDKAGVTLDGVTYLAGFGKPPQNVTFWGLPNDAATRALTETLKAGGFTDMAGPVPGILANGKPGTIELQNRDPLDPWRGPLGKSYALLPLGSQVVQAPAADAMAVLSKATPSAADSPVVATALDGLAAGQGTIIQAALISPAFGLVGGDPTRVIVNRGAKPGASDRPGTLDEAKRKAPSVVSSSRPGIPVYLGGILADAQRDGRPALVVSLAYPDCGMAERAVADIQTRWRDSMTGVEAEASGQAVASGSACAAVVSFVGPQRNDAGNPVVTQVMRRYLQRAFTVLQIGTTP